MIQRWLIILMLFLVVPQYASAVGVPDSWDEASTDLDFSDEISPPDMVTNPSTDDENAAPLAQDDVESKSDLSDQVNIVNRLQILQQELAELRGHMDEQTQLIQKLQEQQEALSKIISNKDAVKNTSRADTSAPKQVADLSNTNVLVPPAIVRQLPETTQKANQPPPSHPNNTTSFNSVDEQVSYLAAYDLVKHKKYPEARKAMQVFLQKYPTSGYLANVHYWLGELYMLEKNPTQAMSHFEWVLHQYPQSGKCSASLLKLGYILADSGKIALAKTRFNAVLTQYPDTHAAKMARLKLDTLGG